MADIQIRVAGCAGRVTLNRPEALNALTHAMMEALDAALIVWADDPAIDLVIIDAAGPRAFCAGGDIAQLYAEGRAGNFGFGQAFWRGEYRMNLRIARYPKPIVSLMQGFTMGGGVGVGCHASHRIVGESSQIAMPECGIGLVPDVGGSWLLAQGPGHLGRYLGTTGTRMGPGDAIRAGFADQFIPEAEWPATVAALEAQGIAALVPRFHLAPTASLAALQPQIDLHFAAPDLAAIWHSLTAENTDFSAGTRKALLRASPLAAAAAIDMQARLTKTATLEQALELEYRFTHRAQEQGDFLEGIRAAIIDKDRSPVWRHAAPDAVPAADIAAMLAPLGTDTWKMET